MQALAGQLLFLANRNAGQAIPPLFWPVNCIKIGGHIALLSDPTVKLELNTEEGFMAYTAPEDAQRPRASALTTNFHILVSRGRGWLGISQTIKF